MRFNMSRCISFPWSWHTVRNCSTKISRTIFDYSRTPFARTWQTNVRWRECEFLSPPILPDPHERKSVNKEVAAGERDKSFRPSRKFDECQSLSCTEPDIEFYRYFSRASYDSMNRITFNNNVKRCLRYSVLIMHSLPAKSTRTN